MHLILYSKPGCHLCEGLQEKLSAIQSVAIALEIRDITIREDWFQAYQYEIPVLFLVQEHLPRGAAVAANSPAAAQPPTLAQPPSPSLVPLPRISPRASVAQVEKMLQSYLEHDPPK